MCIMHTVTLYNYLKYAGEVLIAANHSAVLHTYMYSMYLRLKIF
jgi:hypothetical protein